MTQITPIEVARPATLLSKFYPTEVKMLRAWLLTLDILISLGLVRLPKQEQSKQLDEHQFDQNEKQQRCSYDEDRLD